MASPPRTGPDQGTETKAGEPGKRHPHHHHHERKKSAPELQTEENNLRAHRPPSPPPAETPVSQDGLRAAGPPDAVPPSTPSSGAAPQPSTAAAAPRPTLLRARTAALFGPSKQQAGPRLLLGNEKEVNLTGKKLGDAGAMEVADEFRRGSQTKRLNLGQTGTTDKGVTALAQALAHNEYLHRLSLGLNRITDEGAFEIAKLLETNTTLVRLYMGDNSITDKGAVAIAKVLASKNGTLKELGLSRCDITDSCVPAWIEVIRKNEALRSLKLSAAGNIGMTASSGRAFLKAIKHNDTLERLWIVGASSHTFGLTPAIFSGLKGRKDPLSMFQDEITKQLSARKEERKKTKAVARQANVPITVSTVDIFSAPGAFSGPFHSPQNASPAKPAAVAPAATGTSPPTTTSPRLGSPGTTSPGTSAPPPAASLATRMSPPRLPSPPRATKPERDTSPRPSGSPPTAPANVLSFTDPRPTGPPASARNPSPPRRLVSEHHRMMSLYLPSAADPTTDAVDSVNALQLSPRYRPVPLAPPPQPVPAAPPAPPSSAPTLEQHMALVAENAQLKYQLEVLEAESAKKTRRIEKLKADIQDQRISVIHPLSMELEALRKELDAVRAKASKRAQKISKLKEQIKQQKQHAPPPP